MGIAAGMVLREHFAASGALRVEVLCVVFICYWKWAPACILNYLLRHKGELLAADAQGRAALYERAWQEAMASVKPQVFSVAANRREATVEVVPRSKVRALGGPAAEFFTYHLVMNPAKRRTAEVEFKILMADLCAGRLEVATEKLAASFASPGATAASGATYVDLEGHLQKVGLWSHATYARTAFLRWLFRAEDVPRSFSERDWLLLAGMGSGAEKGIQAAGDIGYEAAVQICNLISKDFWAASGATYELDDLICFLCLSQNEKEVIEGGAIPGPAPPVTVLGDLGTMYPEGRARVRLTSKFGGSSGPPAAADSQAASGAASSAGSPSDGSSGFDALGDSQAFSGIASPAGSPADLISKRPRWRAGVLREPRPELDWQVVWDRCLSGILELLCYVDQARFSRSSRSEQRKTMPLVWGWGSESWEAVRCRVQCMFLTDVPHLALTASGVSRGTMYRALGCAMDLCDQLASRPLPGEMALLCMAIVRCALKYELNRDHVDAMAKHFREGGCLHRPGVGTAERFIIMRMPN